MTVYFSGEFVNGQKHGQGEYNYISEDQHYLGRWKFDQRSGQGKMSYNNDGPGCIPGVYEGAWSENKHHGFGTFTGKDSNFVYTGDWKKGDK